MILRIETGGVSAGVIQMKDKGFPLVVMLLLLMTQWACGSSEPAADMPTTIPSPQSPPTTGTTPTAVPSGPEATVTSTGSPQHIDITGEWINEADSRAVEIKQDGDIVEIVLTDISALTSYWGTRTQDSVRITHETFRGELMTPPPGHGEPGRLVVLDEGAALYVELWGERHRLVRPD